MFDVFKVPTPTVTVFTPTTPVMIHETFNIKFTLTIPSGFNNILQVQALPVQNTTDGKPRVKLCSAVVTYSGENLPCPKCMDTAQVYSYAQLSNYSIPDAFIWTIDSLANLGLRATSESASANTMMYVLVLLNLHYKIDKIKSQKTHK
jgi:hypothetical protein